MGRFGERVRGSRGRGNFKRRRSRIRIDLVRRKGFRVRFRG